MSEIGINNKRGWSLLATPFVFASTFWNSDKSGCLMIVESAVTANSFLGAMFAPEESSS